LPLSLSKQSEKTKKKSNKRRRKEMKEKIVGIFVCMLMIATAVPAAGKTTEIIGNQSLSTTLKNEDVHENVYASHEPEIDWQNLYGGPNHEVFRDIKQTTDGGYITVGVWNSTSHWLVKLDANGQEQWNVTALPNVTLWPRCYIVEQTKDGGYVTAGCGEDSAAIIGYNRCIWKADKDGNTEWLKIYDDPLHGYHMSIKQTSDDGYIVSGEIEVTQTDHDVLLFKTDPSGNVEWQHIWSFGNLEDQAYAVEQTADGGYILEGKTERSTTDAQLLVIKTDAQGNITWNKTYGGRFLEWTQSNDILMASDGGYYFLAETNSLGAGNNDMWLVKTDANGNEQWNRTFGGKYYDMSGGLYFADDGNILITGSTHSFTTYGDGFIIKIDPQGNIIWQDTFGNTREDQLQAIICTSDGGCIVAGNSDTTGSSGYGGWDGWVMKLKDFDNNQPDQPAKPSGTKRGGTGTQYIYTTSTSDSDGDQVYYLWNWGDGNQSKWLGPYNSSEVCQANHTWGTKGKYPVKVMSKDSYGREGNWSDPLTVTMPLSNTIPYQKLWERLFERFPHIFPILRHLLGY
jgi:hypothetical protein